MAVLHGKDYCMMRTLLKRRHLLMFTLWGYKYIRFLMTSFTLGLRTDFGSVEMPETAGYGLMNFLSRGHRMLHSTPKTLNLCLSIHSVVESGKGSIILLPIRNHQQAQISFNSRLLSLKSSRIRTQVHLV